MKNIKLFALLLISLQSTMYAAQESSDYTKAWKETSDFAIDKKFQDYTDQKSHQKIINQTVKSFPNLVEGFDILQEQSLANQSFYDYVGSKLSHDEDEDSGDVITDAIDLVVEKMKVPFLSTLNQAIMENIETTKIHNQIFLYVMKYKDGFMRLPIKQWVNEKDKKNHDRTPLHVAVTEKNKEFANILIAAGANLNFKTNSGWAPLHAAAVYNYPEMAHILITAGANINIQDNVGETPLHSATLNDNAEMANMLITAGANVNIQDKYGSTPLHRATSNNKEKIIRILINANAHLNIKDIDNLIAEQRASTFKIRTLFKQAKQKNDAHNMATLKNQI